MKQTACSPYGSPTPLRSQHHVPDVGYVLGSDLWGMVLGWNLGAANGGKNTLPEVGRRSFPLGMVTFQGRTVKLRGGIQISHSLTNSVFLLKIDDTKRKRSYTNHQFSGVNLLLLSGRVISTWFFWVSWKSFTDQSYNKKMVQPSKHLFL